MATFSARPTLSTMKKAVLRTIQGLVNKSLYRAIEILFQPCCDVEILDVVATCNGTNYDITITLNKAINLIGNGEILLIIGNALATIDSSALISYNDTAVINLQNVDIHQVAGNYSVSVIFLLPAGQTAGNINNINDITPGAFLIAGGGKASLFTFPPCLT